MQLQIRKQTGHARAVGKHGALGSKNDTFYKDITNFVSIISFYLLFASGVFRQIEAEGWVWDLLRSSPLYQIIGNTRDYVFGLSTEIASFATISTIFVALSMVFSLTIFYRGERYVDKIL